MAASNAPGDPTIPPLGDVDIRTDVPSYRVFRDGVMVEELPDISALWRDDIDGSIAHAEGLARAGIITQEEAAEPGGLRKKR